MRKFLLATCSHADLSGSHTERISVRSDTTAGSAHHPRAHKYRAFNFVMNHTSIVNMMPKT